MKKILSVFAATAALVASAALISCGSEASDFDGATDTVYSLPSPSVSAKAYPGVNYISWEPIAGATKYELYRTSDGDEATTALLATANTYRFDYADIAASDHVLSDGKTYKYTVVAVSKSDPSRAVAVKSSQASASVKAIVPAAGTNVADFTDSYTKNYLKKLDAENLAKNASVSVADGNFYAEYPATAGFKYTVAVLDDGKYAARGNAAITGTVSTANYKEDYKAEYKTTATASGKYTAYLKVESVSDLYTPYYITLGSKEIADIDESSATDGTSADWIAEKTVRVSWTPATLKATGDYTATTNYKVYRSSDADNTWVALSATVVKGEKETTTTTPAETTVATVYYIDDTVEDNTIGYTYYVVHTDGTYYGAYDTTGSGTPTTYKNQASVSAYKLAQTKKPDVTATACADDATGLKDTIKIVATKDTTDYNQTLAISYVKLAEDADGTAITTYAADAFTAITLANNNGKDDSYTVYIKDAAAGTYVIKVVASETGKKDNVAYDVVTVAAADVDNTGLSASLVLDATETGSKHVLITDTSINDDTNALANYTYDLYKVVISETDKYTDIVTVTTSKVNTEALALTKAAATDDLVTKFNVTEGTYATARSVSFETGTLITNYFYVQKALKSDATKYVKVTATNN